MKGTHDTWPHGSVLVALAHVAALGALSVLPACGPPPGGVSCPGAPPDYPPGPYGTDVGNTLCDFAVRVQSGASGTPAPRRLSDYRAMALASPLRVLALFGEAEWCLPCGHQQADLERVFAAHVAARDVAIVAVISEAIFAVDDSTMQRWALAYGLSIDVARDPAKAMPSFFDPRSYPAAMVIRLDDMTIRARWQGNIAGRIEAEIDAALR